MPIRTEVERRCRRRLRSHLSWRSRGGLISVKCLFVRYHSGGCQKCFQIPSVCSGRSYQTRHPQRRTFDKLAFQGGAKLDQIQLSLGHASIQTTERYLGVQQDLTDAPCDYLHLKVE